jgi:hypothetical protein
VSSACSAFPSAPPRTGRGRRRRPPLCAEPGCGGQGSELGQARSLADYAPHRLAGCCRTRLSGRGPASGCRPTWRCGAAVSPRSWRPRPAARARTCCCRTGHRRCAEPEAWHPEGGEVGRHAHLPRGGVEVDVDVHLLATGGAVLGAEVSHGGAAHDSHGAAVGVAVDGALTVGRRPAPRASTTSSGTCMPVAVRPLCRMLVRDRISVLLGLGLAQALKNSARAGARAAGSTLCSWPSRL